MVSQPRPGSFFRYVVSLVLLLASVGAPFRSHALGRTWLSTAPHAGGLHTAIRVHAVSGGGVTCGFRVVAGVVGGGRHGAGARARVHWDVAEATRTIAPSSVASRAAKLLHLPLRC